MTSFVRAIFQAFSEAHILSSWPRVNRQLLLTSVIITSLYVALAIVLGREPGIVEILWVWFCQAGCVYHLTELGESVRARLVLAEWEEVDIIDCDVANTEIRHHFLRWIGKSVFLIAGLISLFLPPRINEVLDLWTSIIIACLLSGLFLLDMNAVSDYSSRIWRLSHLGKVREERELRRRGLEHDTRSNPIRPIHPGHE